MMTISPHWIVIDYFFATDSSNSVNFKYFIQLFILHCKAVVTTSWLHPYDKVGVLNQTET